MYKPQPRSNILDFGSNENIDLSGNLFHLNIAFSTQINHRQPWDLQRLEATANFTIGPACKEEL